MILKQAKELSFSLEEVIKVLVSYSKQNGVNVGDYIPRQSIDINPTEKQMKIVLVEPDKIEGIKVEA